MSGGESIARVEIFNDIAMAEPAWRQLERDDAERVRAGVRIGAGVHAHHAPPSCSTRCARSVASYASRAAIRSSDSASIPRSSTRSNSSPKVQRVRSPS